MNNPETENHPDAVLIDDNDSIELNGSWEKKGRSITAAAYAALLGIGVLYFNVQSIVMMMIFFIYQAISPGEISGDFMERMNSITETLKVPILVALVISQFVFMFYPTIWIVKRWHTHEIKKYLRIRWCSFKEIILAVLITIAMLPFCYYVSYLLLDWLEIPEVVRNMGAQLFTANSVFELVMLILVIAVTPAVCEEVFFRGYVQRTMERTNGMKSFIITGIVFGLFHFQPLSLISLSILGVLFSFFYYRSKSIFPSSAAHFTNNFIAIMLLYLSSQSVLGSSLEEGNIPIIWVILSTLIAAGLVVVYIKITPGKVDVEFEHRFTNND
ncbi:MAG: CPBP family intramembrane metalloprotease [Ignavibacteriales bacterium]|nr:MAG: CPBP family intramembrane metalloprotease [Ignavibacteriales bacterium]